MTERCNKGHHVEVQLIGGPLNGQSIFISPAELAKELRYSWTEDGDGHDDVAQVFGRNFGDALARGLPLSGGPVQEAIFERIGHGMNPQKKTPGVRTIPVHPGQSLALNTRSRVGYRSGDDRI